MSSPSEESVSVPHAASALGESRGATEQSANAASESTGAADAGTTTSESVPAASSSGLSRGQEMHRPIRVCIVDDDTFVTTSLATILSAEPDVDVVGKAHDGNEAVSLFERVLPDVMLMDIQMPGADGLCAAERILATHPDARVVFLTTFSDDEYIVRALRLGAKGYLIKQEVSTIAPALRSVMAGQSVLGEEVLDRVDALMRKTPQQMADSVPGVSITTSIKSDDQEAASLQQLAEAMGALSERERAVVELVADGLDNKDIAATLYISEGTARNHISTILQKLEMKNRTQLAIAYYRAR